MLPFIYDYQGLGFRVYMISKLGPVHIAFIYDYQGLGFRF